MDYFAPVDYHATVQLLYRSPARRSITAAPRGGVRGASVSGAAIRRANERPPPGSRAPRRARQMSSGRHMLRARWTLRDANRARGLSNLANITGLSCRPRRRTNGRPEVAQTNANWAHLRARLEIFSSVPQAQCLCSSARTALGARSSCTRSAARWLAGWLASSLARSLVHLCGQSYHTRERLVKQCLMCARAADRTGGRNKARPLTCVRARWLVQSYARRQVRARESHPTTERHRTLSRASRGAYDWRRRRQYVCRQINCRLANNNGPLGIGLGRRGFVKNAHSICHTKGRSHISVFEQIAPRDRTARRGTITREFRRVRYHIADLNLDPFGLVCRIRFFGLLIV